RGMLISVVGDIDAATLGQKLDEAFGSLPDTEPPAPPPEATVASGPALKLIGMDMPQSLILFGGPGLLRKDQDFIPAYVMNQILGGSGLGSRLSTVVREKNGLTYGIDTGLLPLRRAGYFIGSFSTRNEKAGEAMALVRQELARMAQDGPTQQELDQAKTYLTGSYALRFDSNAKIAAQLLAIQQDNLGIDYINRRNSLVEAVTMDQVKEQAKRLLHPDQLLLSVVGRPKGL
ncbi:MAG TPA: insulinase family protein, partial [Aestuariivirga sp.]|nr:insulinase family protein [Aestuariivirga sp.]